MNVIKHNGSTEPLDIEKIRNSLLWASKDCKNINISDLELSAKLELYDGIKTSFIHDIFIKTAEDMSSLRNIEWDEVAKNLILQKIYKEVNGSIHPLPLRQIIDRGIQFGKYTKNLLSLSDEELSELDNEIVYDRDFTFTASGIKALLKSYSFTQDSKQIELPQHMFMLIAIDAFRDYPDNKMHYIKKLYHALSTFKITLPTPEMNALRTDSHDYASCTLLRIGDTLDSWNEGSKAIVNHTAASAGVGVDLADISSISDLVKNGKITHGGKVPVIKSNDADVQKATQNGRRGSATNFISFYDPEIIQIMSLKSPRTDIAKRVNDMSYGIKINQLVYDRAREGESLSLFSVRVAPKLLDLFCSDDQEGFIKEYERLEELGVYSDQIDARNFMKIFNTECYENSSYYPVNIDEVNLNKPYTENIYQSNICVEEVSPTKPVSSERPNDPDIAICVLGNLNQGLIGLEDIEQYADLLVRLQTHIMLRQNHPMPQSNAYVREYRSIGLGISNHAYWLAKQGLKYGEQEALDKHDEWMEAFQYYMIMASMNLAKEIGEAPRFRKYTSYAQGIMPIDRYKKTVDELTQRKPSKNWDMLRTLVLKNGMANCALTMIPPSESSSVPSNQTSGMEPIKNLLTYKKKKHIISKQYAPDPIKLADKYDYAYDTKDMTKRYLKNVAVSQKWICKSASANRWYNPDLYEDGKVSIVDIVADMYFAKYYGAKTLYYTNTRVSDVAEESEDGHFYEIEEDSGCAGGGCNV
jgi:ribonucleoside-diphosphate reductase alpha chain